MIINCINLLFSAIVTHFSLQIADFHLQEASLCDTIPLENYVRRRCGLNIEYSKNAIKHIKEQDKSMKQRLKTAIEKLPDGDVKKLKGLQNDYRLRVGNLRVLFSIENDIIIIKDVLPRGQAYKRL